MAKRRRRYRRGRRRRGNWFTRMKTWQKVLLIIAMFLLIILTGLGFYVASKWGKVDTQQIKTEDIIINPEIKKNRELDLGDGYTNIALFGVDSRDGSLGEGNRTDCIIVASLNNETKEIKMVSVYRDTLLDLSEGTYQKCNAAYSYGGPTLAINMLNMNLDLDIQDYVTVDFGAITDVVDAVGGIELDITDEEAECINDYSWETAGSSGKEVILLSGGGHLLLDGVQATTYARIRSTAGGDFTRTERQRLVIEKIVEKLKRVNVKTLNKIIDQVFPQISTSFTLSELMNYAIAYKDYVLLENTGFPFDNALDSIPGVGSVVVPSDLASNVTKLHEFLFGTIGYTPSSTVYTLSGNISSMVNGSSSSYSDSGYTEDTMTEEQYYEDPSVNGNYDEQGMGGTGDMEGTETVDPNAGGQGDVVGESIE